MAKQRDLVNPAVLASRIREYQKTNITVEANDLVQYLRASFETYKRTPLQGFKKAVFKSIRDIQIEERRQQKAAVNDGDNVDIHVVDHGPITEPEHPMSITTPTMSASVTIDTGSRVNDATDQEPSDTPPITIKRGKVELVEVRDKNVFNSRLAAKYKKIAAEKQKEEAAAAAASAAANAAVAALAASASASAANNSSEMQIDTTPQPLSEGASNAAAQSPTVATPTTAASNDETEAATEQLKRGVKRSRGSEAKERRKKALTGDDKGGRLSAEVYADRPTIRYSDLGGIDGALQDIRENLEYPLTHPEIYRQLGVEPPRGILLHGPPGCGKTMLAHAIAGELGVAFFKISAPEIVSGMSGESEQKLRSLFKDAMASAPSLIFIDEIDAITPKRETATREMERRIVAQLLTCMDDISWENTNYKAVIVIGATNRPDALDPALRRAGRFDREIALGIPDEQSRARILSVMSSKLRLSGDFDFNAIAKKTPGFVGADLNSLAKEAAVIAVNRIFRTLFSDNIPIESHDSANADSASLSQQELLQQSIDKRTVISNILRDKREPLSDEQLSQLSITMQDFDDAIKKVQPSSKREGFATIPDVTWDDIGSLHDIRDELNLAIMEPIRCPERFTALGLTAPAGVLLYGPPGCGKTLLAKAIANESGANFISIKGPELLNKYVGESERAVRQVFTRGRASAPCVIFFDELDALCPRRSNDSASSSTERVVNQLLTEMDGLESRRQVFVIAATNRPDMIDPAMLRPGRLDKLLYVPLPAADNRRDILGTLTRKTPLAADVDLSKIAHDHRCEDFSGADLAALVREAAVFCLRETLAEEMSQPRRAPEQGSSDKKQFAQSIVSAKHFEMAFSKVLPSVSKKDLRVYNSMQTKLRHARSQIHKRETAEPTINENPIADHNSAAADTNNDNSQPTSMDTSS